jgi:5-methylcytosine-specific restriction endonuclease McrA
MGWPEHKKINLLGQRFGKLLVIFEDFKTDLDRKWLCWCECGKITSVKQNSLRQGLTTSCGFGDCRYLRNDLKGIRSGKLIALKPAPNHKGGTRLWEAKCDCGNSWVGRGSLLKHHRVLSCGCLLELSNSNRLKYGKLGEKKRERKFCQKEFDWKTGVKDRDKRTCVICESKQRIVAHHLESFHCNLHLRYDLNNGITLCFGCHKKFHSEYGQKYNTRLQFEEFRIKYSTIIRT